VSVSKKESNAPTYVNVLNVKMTESILRLEICKYFMIPIKDEEKMKKIYVRFLINIKTINSFNNNF